MAVQTAESFLHLLEKSNLLSRDQFAVAREVAGQAADARALAWALVRKEVLTRWQAGQLLTGRTDFFWGKYKLVDFLGRGGMGSVFLAWHTMMNRPVALKSIARELGKDPAALERFFTEARAIAALDHPNIVHAYDVASEGDRYYMVMEYVEGQDLQRMVEKKGPLEVTQAADYIRQAAEGLAHAHSRDMIHCDIKPANLFVNQQGVVKILDMGMARAIGRKEQLGAPDGEGENDQAVLGTADYLAPETGLGHDKLDRRADIYSLGCTLYFLLTGRPPFPHGTLAERIVKHQTQEPEEIAELRPEAPAELIRICRKMMAKDPNDRFQTADETGQALASWHPPAGKVLRAAPLEEAEAVAGEGAAQGGLAEPAGVPWVARLIERAGRFLAYVRADRRRTMIWGVASGAVVVLLVAVTMWWIVTTVKARKRHAVVDRPAAAKPAKVAPKEDDDFKGLKLKFEEPASEQVTAPEAKPVGPPPKPGPPPPPVVPGVRPPPPVPGATAPAESPKSDAAPPPAKAADSKPAAPSAEGKPAAPSEPMAAKPAEKPAAEAEAAAEKPAAPSPAKPDAAKPAASSAKAEPSSAQAKKPASEKPAPEKPAPPPDPLRDFPKVVELPPMPQAGAGEFGPGPQLLGPIHAPLEAPCTLTLFGADSALPGKREFGWEEAKGEGKNALWVVSLKPLPKETTTMEVGRFLRDKEGLKFQWAAGAAEAQGDYLGNCALHIALGGKTRFVALRPPVQVDPVVFDLQKSATIVKVPIEFPPNKDNLRFEITGVEGRDKKEEKPVLQPAAPVPLGTRNPLTLIFPRKDSRGRQVEGVQFQVTADLKGKVIEVRVQNPSPAEFKRILQLVATQRIGMEEESRRLRQQLSHAKEEPKKVEIAKKLEPIDTPLWYEAFYQQVHRKGQLQFRVWLEMKEQRIELVRTEVPK